VELDGEVVANLASSRGWTVAAKSSRQVSISPTTRSACRSSGASPTNGPTLGIASIVDVIISPPLSQGARVRDCSPQWLDSASPVPLAAAC
jgi:hypothetical protein